MKLQEFSFGNFRSFKDINTLNLSAAKIKSKHESIDTNNVIIGKNIENISFLKSKAIYGANASGKSNIIKALVTFSRIIRTSVKDDKVLNMIDSFRLSTETENEPSFFQIIFWDKNTKYRYGFELDDENIYSEWLYGKPGERELCYFIREGKEIIELDKTNFSEGDKLKTLLFDEESEENEIFRNNSLFLSTLATFGFAKLSKQLVKSITSTYIISGLGHEGMYRYAGESLKDKEKKKYILDFLKYGDIGIEDLNAIEISSDDLPDDLDNDVKKDFDKSKKRKLLISSRKKYDANNKFVEDESFSFSLHESEGTQKLFELSPFIYQALSEQRTIIIDEFDARFHPLLTKKILELFNSKINKGAQLIFTTHDTNLLSSDLLRRDQIEFVEKDKFGASHLYSLVQFKGIRNNATFEKDYIQGKYGAIPFLGNFNKILNFED
ncbi:AAA family ATPase [Winogradskyella sp. PC-19]|uniref:AAA family ATPase n=1 Tax=unclassified Winogradskyella TaxID=2615021 RepID=UPI000B3CBEEC|nr:MULTISPECIES: ATP-binding protein [unclassified Winogradskyella]ARV08280.1 AAA family ATPase [Winogradskyella sp. PC-19]